MKALGAMKLCDMAERLVTDRCFEVANQALQLHGGYGYLAEFGFKKSCATLRVHHILKGTNEVTRPQQWLVAQAFIPRDAWFLGGQHQLRARKCAIE